MRKLLASILAAFALSVSGPVLAGSPCAGISNCDDNQIQGQAQGQGQLQGQLQGQGQGQQQGMAQGQIGINKQNQNAYGGNGYAKAYGGNAHQGQAQGQIGINKNNNSNKVLGIQGQLQGNKQKASNTVNIQSDASGNRVAAFAPSISSRSTTNCITTYSASGGSGGTGSVFSLGFSLPIRDEDCVMEQAVRTGFESNVPEAQALALDLYRHQMTAISVREGHITAATVLDAEGNAQKVAYSEELSAFVPVESHPKFQEAAATVFARAMLANGYKPNVTAVGGSGFQRVSFPTMEGIGYVDMDEDLIESVIGEIDDDANKMKFTSRNAAEGN